MASLVTFAGLTGANYQYENCDVNLAWNEVPANYCFARMQGLDYVVPLYFGQTQNLAERMSNHNKLTLASTYGATMILAHVNQGGELARTAEEQDLIRAYNPPCNVQHRTGPGGLLGLHSPVQSPLVSALLRGKK